MEDEAVAHLRALVIDVRTVTTENARLAAECERLRGENEKITAAFNGADRLCGKLMADRESWGNEFTAVTILKERLAKLVGVLGKVVDGSSDIEGDDCNYCMKNHPGQDDHSADCLYFLARQAIEDQSK